MVALSFKDDIAPLFVDDVDCMADHGVFLDSYAYMANAAGNAAYPDHAHARKVYDHLTGVTPPAMPPGAPWPAARIALYKRWMDDGFAP
jgi:hypothetical protein